MPVLITNGGTHSPTKWAVATAERIFVINPAMEDERLLLARKLQTQIVEMLITHHATVQGAERGSPRLDADDLADREQALAEGNEVFDLILSLLQGTPWEEQYNMPEARQQAVYIIAGDFLTNRHIERQDHARKNDSPEGRAFLDRHFKT